MSILFNLDTGASERVGADSDTGLKDTTLDPFLASLACDGELQHLLPLSSQRLMRRTITTNGDIVVEPVIAEQPNPSSGMFSPAAEDVLSASSPFLVETDGPLANVFGAFGASALAEHCGESSSTSDSMFDLKRLALDDRSAGAVRLQITEQPIDKFRFRYKSEMHGTHGSLTGASSDGKKKTYPTVELVGYDGPAIVRCSLHQTDEKRSRLHSHLLVIRQNNDDQRDPHEVHVKADKWGAEFPGMGIIHTAKRCIGIELHDKLMTIERMRTGRELTEFECQRLRLQADTDARDMDLNRVCLCFEAFRVENGQYRALCEPVYSRPINNMKSAMTGELKITRLSATCCDAGGGTDLFLFVEKVGKKNIKVRFYELDDRGETVWEAFGQFSESDVHHQYAIALRTPPYRDRNIEETVDVLMQLYRESDKCYSEPKPFHYKPRNITVSRKRARHSSALNSAELPTVLQHNSSVRPTASSSTMLIDANGWPSTISKEYDTNRLIDSLLCGDPAMLSSNLQQIPEPLFFLDSDIDNNPKKYEMLMDEWDLQHDGASHPAEKPVNVFGAMVARLRQKIDQVAQTDGRPKAREILQKVWLQKNVYGILNASLSEDETAACQIVQLLADYDLVQLLDLLLDSDHAHAMHAACLFNRTRCLALLLRHNVDPNVRDASNAHNTPLHVAVTETNVECVRLLCEQRTEHRLLVDATNDDGCSPLHLAVRQDNVDMVRLLTAAGAFAGKLEECSGNNALHLAVQCNSRDLVQYLRSATDAEARNTSNLTASDMAMMDSCHPDIRAMLGCRSTAAADAHNEDDAPVEMDVAEELPVGPQAVAFVAPAEVDAFGHIPLFDDIGLHELCALLNVDGRWRQFAHQLNIVQFAGEWTSFGDPSRAMFGFAEKNGFRLKAVVQAFVDLDDREALSILDEMIARTIEKQ